MISPIFEQLSGRYGAKMAFLKVEHLMKPKVCVNIAELQGYMC